MLILEMLYSQTKQEWIARYSEINIDEATEMTIDNVGNIYITGYSYGTGSLSDYATIKYNSSGNQQWVIRYNGPGKGYEFANAIFLDNEESVYVTGSSAGIETGPDYATIKYNSQGTQQWIKRHSSSGNNNDAAYDMVIDNNGDVLVTGVSYNGIGLGDYLTIKYDPNGAQLWSASHTNGIASSIAVDDSNNVFVTGTSMGDFTTIKYNPSGIQRWVSAYNGIMNSTDAAKSVGVDNSGNVYVAGSSIGAMYYYDFAVVKYNSSGIEQWVRRYEGSAHFMDQLRAMIVDKSGNVYVTGSSTEIGTGYDYTTIKYNTNGDLLWIAHYHNGAHDIPFAITKDNKGNIYVTGESDGNGTGLDYATVCYDSLGIQKWVTRYDYSGQYGDIASSIKVDNFGNVFVTGTSNRDYLTIKYSQLTSLNSASIETPLTYKLDQNYPNPFNPETVISFELKVMGRAQLIVYDVLGNEVAMLVNENKPAGSYEVVFDGSNYASGIYFYRLEVNGNHIDTKRMILLK